MATLSSYKSKRTTTQNALAAFFVMLVAFAAFGVLPTQWFAFKHHYDPNLGEVLYRGVGGIAVYQPTQWVMWGLRLGDVQHLRASVQVMLFLGLASMILAIIFGLYVAHKLNKHSAGMEGLHGTAHFAEREDVDRTGFIEARKHKASGVVVGSVMMDARGRVIHPNHKKFAKRYSPVYINGGWRDMWRKKPKRDGNGMPMYAPNADIVKKTSILRDGKNTHLFAFCPTRSGKGVGMVIPTLLTWPHSVMVNDPKGEAYALSAGFRQHAGQDIIKFEPACTNGTGARWNPLDEIRTFTLRDVADCQMIMSMACDPKGEGLDDYFDKAGYEFLTAVALHVLYDKSCEGSLAGVANYLGDPSWDNDTQMYNDMMQAVHDPDGVMNWKTPQGRSTKTHPMIANAAKTMLNKEDKDRSGVLSTAKSLLSLYLDPIVAMNTTCSDFLVRDLMTGKKPVSLYYVVSPADMERLVPLTRLFYALFIRRNAADMAFKDGRSVANYSFPLLMIIDEASSLRKLPILQEALGYVAGYGIRMFMLVQDITQVEELYGDKQSFDSGAETRIVYAPNKIETAEKLARMTGKTTVTEENASNSRDIIGIKAGSVSISTSKTGRDLITADEFMALHDQDVVLFVKGQPPIYGRKAFYYENPTLLARASMPPPERSSTLRLPKISAPVAPKEVAGMATTTAADEWATARAAMKANLLAALPVTSSKPSAPGAAATGNQAAKEPPKTSFISRYASKADIVTEDEKRQVRDMVSDLGLVDKVVSVSAF